MKSKWLAPIAIFCLLAGGAVAADEVYVAGFAAKKLYRVNSAGQLKRIPLPGNPLDLALSGDGEFLYVSQPGTDGVSVIRTSDDSTAALIPTPSSPAKMAIGNGDRRLYVAHDTVAPPHVTIIDITRGPQGRSSLVLGSIDLSAHGASSAFAVAAFGDSLAVGTRTGHVLLYDTAASPPAFIGMRAVGSRVRHVIFSPLGAKLYVLLGTPASGTDESGRAAPPGNLHILRVPALTLKAVLSLGQSGLRSAAAFRTSQLYMTDVRGFIHALDMETDTVTGSTAVGEHLSGIAATENRLFIADSARDSVLTIAPTGHPRSDRVERSVSLEPHAAPTGLAALRATAAAKRR